MTKRRNKMESKPGERYEVVPNMGVLTKPADPGGNGKQVPDGLATIDEQSRQAAMAKAMIENDKRRREQACGEEINRALVEICKKHHCQLHFMELRQDGTATKIWVQPIFVDEQAT